MESPFQFVDNRPEAIAQRKLQEMANNSPRMNQLRTFQEMANKGPKAKKTTQLKAMTDNFSSHQQHPIQKVEEEEALQMKSIAPIQKSAEEEELQMKPFAMQRKEEPERERNEIKPFSFPIQKKENNTGLPDNLKTGMENLSGMSLDDVKVHRNSDKPAQVQAHAYAQGTDIHLGPGQEKHLPHEAWHVVQQKQGRVKPTMQLKGTVNINDDAGLEREADVMGEKAIQFSAGKDVGGDSANVQDGNLSIFSEKREGKVVKKTGLMAHVPIQREVEKDKLNIVGEVHPISEPIRKDEKEYVETQLGKKEEETGKLYWTEHEFAVGEGREKRYRDPSELLIPSGIAILAGLLEQLRDKFEIREDQREEDWDEKLKEVLDALKLRGEGMKIRLNNVEISAEIKPSILNLADTCIKAEKWVYKKRDPKTGRGEVAVLANNFFLFAQNDIIANLYDNEKEKMEYKEVLSDVAYTRSISMLEVAKEYTGEGVWKVGDAHAEHINSGGFGIGKLPEDIAVTRANDFDPKVEKYIDQKKASQLGKDEKQNMGAFAVASSEVQSWDKQRYQGVIEKIPADYTRQKEEGPLIPWKERLEEKWGVKKKE